MFSLFKKSLSSFVEQQCLLHERELHKLRILSEQVDCSQSSNFNLESRQSGNLATRALGSGIDYAESRVYQPGDDPRSINWRVSARSQDTFTKTYHIESRPSLCILLDKRRSMLFGTHSRLKVTQALRTAMVLAYAAELHHLDFQAWIIEDKLGLQHYDDINVFISDANKLQYSNQPNTLKPINNLAFTNALQTINHSSQKGSLVYLISDFSDLDNTHQTELAHLHERCFIQSYHLYDQAELTLPNAGRIKLQALHDATCFHINTQKSKEKIAFEKITSEHFKNIESIITNLGIPYAKLATDNDNIQQTITLPIGQP